MSKPSHLCLDVCLLSLFSGDRNSSLQGLKTENHNQYQGEGACILFQALQLYKLIRCCHFELSFPHPQNRNEIIILKKAGDSQIVNESFINQIETRAGCQGGGENAYSAVYFLQWIRTNHILKGKH